MLVERLFLFRNRYHSLEDTVQFEVRKFSVMPAEEAKAPAETSEAENAVEVR